MGRPTMNPEQTKPVPLAAMASHQLRREVDAAAKAQGKTRSEFIREALRAYMARLQQAAE